MDDPVDDLRVELVDLLRKQIEALEVESYVGLTDSERRDYYKRQDRIRNLDARMSECSDPAALAQRRHHDASPPPR